MAREFIMIQYREGQRERSIALRDKVDEYRSRMPRTADGKKRTMFDAWEALVEQALKSKKK